MNRHVISKFLLALTLLSACCQYIQGFFVKNTNTDAWRKASSKLSMHAPPVDPNAPYSFVNTDMRAVAMKLHTPQQLKKPASGSTPPPPQEPAWTPDVIHYLQFLVDSLVVYETIEQISEEYPVLAPFRNTGLERSKALKEDIAWISSTYDLKVPSAGVHGPGYAAHMRELAKTNMPKYMCHYYNHMFAHTAGGRMIGKKYSDMFFDGKVLNFYQWEGEVKDHMKATVAKVDELANTWNDEEKKACLDETAMSFRYSGALMVYLRPPSPELKNEINV